MTLAAAKSDFALLYVAKDGDLDDTPGDNAEHEVRRLRFGGTSCCRSSKVDTTPGTASVGRHGRGL